MTRPCTACRLVTSFRLSPSVVAVGAVVLLVLREEMQDEEETSIPPRQEVMSQAVEVVAAVDMAVAAVVLRESLVEQDRSLDADLEEMGERSRQSIIS